MKRQRWDDRDLRLLKCSSWGSEQNLSELENRGYHLIGYLHDYKYAGEASLCPRRRSIVGRDTQYSKSMVGKTMRKSSDYHAQISAHTINKDSTHPFQKTKNCVPEDDNQQNKTKHLLRWNNCLPVCITKEPDKHQKHPFGNVSS
jgi:hypothetical protein